MSIWNSYTVVSRGLNLWSAFSASSPVLDEPNLCGLLTELLTLHHDAILADNCHTAPAARHARRTLTLGARDATDRCDERVTASPLLRFATTHECCVSRCE